MCIRDRSGKHDKETDNNDYVEKKPYKSESIDLGKISVMQQRTEISWSDWKHTGYLAETMPSINKRKSTLFARYEQNKGTHNMMVVVVIDSLVNIKNIIYYKNVIWKINKEKIFCIHIIVNWVI